MRNFLVSRGERRIRTRSPASTKVYVYRWGQPVLRSVAVNLSTRGVFLEMEPTGLISGNTVELVFPLVSGAIVKLTRFRAMVVHTCEHGVGLKLQGRR